MSLDPKSLMIQGGRREAREDLTGPPREDEGPMLVEVAVSSLVGFRTDFFGDVKDSRTFAVFAGLTLLELDGATLGTAVERLSCFVDFADFAGIVDLAAGFFLGLPSA
jgi:hypothetical protein